MAKRKRENNTKSIKNKIENGCGKGTLAEYSPWLRVQDIASEGISPRTIGWTTGREHHFLSQLELKYFFALEWSERVVDIREQFPMDLNETLALAKSLNIAHPPKSNPSEPAVMTTDFLITVDLPIGTKEYARTIKYSTDLKSRRTLEKFEIERIYWTRRNISWGIVTELNIDSTLTENIKKIHTFIDIEKDYPQISQSIINKAKTIMTPLLNQEIPICEITKACDEKLSLEIGMSLTIAQHLLATRQWKIDMAQPFQPEKIILIHSTSKGGAL